MNTSPAQALADELITPIIEWTAAERGRKSELVRCVQSAAGDNPPTRNVIESWINPDPEKRTNPSLPYGLLLIQEARRLGILPELKPAKAKR